MFLRNGARLYLDVGSHPEYAIPECDSITDLVVHDKAGASGSWRGCSWTPTGGSATERFQRLHVIVGDSNISDLPSV